MPSTSLTRNAVMHGINQVSAVLLPLIVFPYLARVLLPEGLGRVQFAVSIVGLFTLVAYLGVPVYGVRETARVRDDRSKLTRLTVEMFVLNLLMTGLAVAGFACFMFFSGKAQADPSLFWICSIPLFFVPVGFDWFFQGLEEFSWIAWRSLFFRLLLLAGIFLFVHEPSDYRIYALLLGLNVAGAGVLNAGVMIRKLDWASVCWRELNLLRHIKPVLLMFALWAIFHFYISADKVMLGYLSDESQVGFYSVAEKIIRVAVTALSAVGIVLFPRLSYFVETKQMVEYGRLSGRFFRMLLFLALPCAAGMMVLAGPLISLFAGEAFSAAVLPLRIMGLNVVLIALSGFFGLQIFYPQGREKFMLYAILSGALLNVGLNLFLIPRYHAAGAAAATLTAEMVVVMIQFILSQRIMHFSWPLRAVGRYGLCSLFMALLLVVLLPLFSADWISLVVCAASGLLLYLACMALLKDEVLIWFWRKMMGQL